MIINEASTICIQFSVTRSFTPYELMIMVYELGIKMNMSVVVEVNKQEK